MSPRSWISVWGTPVRASERPFGIVSETLARRYWQGKDAIGQRLKPNLPDAPWYAVVGVAAAVHHWSAEIDAENEATQNPLKPEFVFPDVQNFQEKIP